METLTHREYAAAWSRNTTRSVWLFTIVVLSLHLAVQTAAAAAPQALDFDGINDHVDLGNPPSLNITGELTITAWIKPRSEGATQRIVNKWASGSKSNKQYLFLLDSGRSLRFYSSDGNKEVKTVGSSTLSSDSWHHIAAVFTPSVRQEVFVNGVSDGVTTVDIPSALRDTPFSVYLGAGVSEGIHYFDGVIDEVRIWNTALTPEQVENEMNSATPVSPGLVGAWGLNEGAGATAGDSSGDANDGTILGAVWTTGYPFDAPDQPILNSPPNGATNIFTSPTLDVSVSDPDGDNLTVTFFGRELLPAGNDFTIIVLPDTQFYSESFPQIFQAQTQWIVDNKDALNIVFVTHLGDIVENGDGPAGSPNTQEWLNADTAMSLLEDPLATTLADGIPFGVAVGNHDQGEGSGPTGATTLYNQFFGESRFQGRAYYGGHFGTKNDNHFELFTASGLDFIIIHLEQDPAMDPFGAVLNWADGLLKLYSDRRAIVVCHQLMSDVNPSSFGAQGLAIYDALKDNPNLFLMLGAHNVEEGMREDSFAGNTVSTLISDYQGRPNGGNGWLRILEFSPANGEIRVKTYSPWLDQFEIDSNSQFVLSYAMRGGPFTAIGSSAGVPSGSGVSTVWGPLFDATEHEWFVNVTDGKSSTSGGVWSFTTEAAPSAPGQASSPNPSSGSSEVAAGAILSWAAGSGSISSDVYFGTHPIPAALEFQGNQNVTVFAPGILDYETTYFWRIDEVNAQSTTTGAVWSFTTEGVPPPMNFPDGVRQTFNPDDTTPGLNVGSNAGDPLTATDGDIWYDSTTEKFRCQESGATVDCIGGDRVGILTCSFNVKDAQVADSGKFQCKVPAEATLQRVSCSTSASQASINLYERVETSPNFGTTNLLSSDLACNSDSIADATTSFADSAIAANAVLALAIKSESLGTNDIVRVFVEYRLD